VRGQETDELVDGPCRMPDRENRHAIQYPA
jgi:hypothetical protein